MKRYGEKTLIEAMENGHKIRFYEWFTLSAGYKVIDNNENIVGYITFDLFVKLLQNNKIAKTATRHSSEDYEIVVEKPIEEIAERIEEIENKNDDALNRLDYIISLIENGYTEEDAEKCADYLYSDTWESDEEDLYFNDFWEFEEDKPYSPSNPWDAPGMRISDFI